MIVSYLGFSDRMGHGGATGEADALWHQGQDRDCPPGQQR